MGKVITLNVDGHYISVSDRVLGATGASAATTLRIIFDSSWGETSKRVYFTDARGRVPVSMLLTTNMLVLPDDDFADDTSDIYEVPVPAEVLSYPGTAEVTVQGVFDEDGDGTAEKVMQTASARFTVLDGSVPCGMPSQKPTVDEAMQLQGEIDAIKADIIKAAQAAGAVEDAAAAADRAEEAALRVETALTAAASAAALAEESLTETLASEASAASAAAESVSARELAEAAASAAANSASAAESAAASAAEEAMAKLREICVLKITFDGLFTPGSECTISCTEGAGEVKTIIVPESLRAEVYCHTDTGYAVSCMDATDRVRAATIVTGSDFAEYEVVVVGSHRVPWENATPDNAWALFAMAVEETDVLLNSLAWDGLTLEVVNDNMRFRNSEYGDFFSGEAQNGYTGEGIEFDWRTDGDKLLAKFTDINAIKTRMSWLVRGIADKEVSPSWEWIQHQLLLANMDLNISSLPEYQDRYWWRTRDVRYTSTVTYTDAEGVEHTRPTAATMDDLREKLETYANSTEDEMAQAEAGFRMWFTQDVAVDLVLKRTLSGTNMSGAMTMSVVPKLLKFALEHKDTGKPFSDITWSQVMTAILNGFYATKKGAQTFTYGDRRAWMYNAWIEPQCAWIFGVGDLITAIQNEEYPGLDAFDDLRNPNLDFHADEIAAESDVGGVLTGAKTAYVSAGGAWTDLAANLDSAWYLLQYYLDHGELVTDGTNVLEDTATAGKEVYYWKDGWGTRTKVTDMTSLRSAALSGVPARLEWLKINGPSDSEWKSGGLSGAKGTSVTWPEIIEAIGRSNPSNAVVVWSMRLQFLIVHKDAAREDADTFGANEAAKFYWWLDGQNEVYLTPAGGANPSAGAIMESIMRVMAAGDNLSGAITKDGALGKNVAALNIRKPSSDAKTERSELDTYNDTELLTVALRALVREVYENVAAANAPSGYETWDFIDDDGTFTYNKAAYDAVRNLNVYQVQHWLATNGASYEISEVDGKNEYWWIERERFVDWFANFREMVVNLLGFARSSYDRSDALKEMLRAEWDYYGFSKDADTVLSEGYVTCAKIQELITSAKTTYSWLQLEYLARDGSIYTKSKAASQAKKDGIVAPKMFAEGLTISANEMSAARDSRTIYDMKVLFTMALGYALVGGTEALDLLLADEWDKYGFSASAEDASYMLLECAGDLTYATIDDDLYSWAQMEVLFRAEMAVSVADADEYKSELEIVVPERFEGHVTITWDDILAVGGA